MKIRNICNPTVITAEAATPLAEVAKLMRKNHVGTVVVVDGAKSRNPIGMVTDRDIVVEVVAAGLDPRTLSAGEIMITPVVTASVDEDITWSLKVMRDHGIRRLPVVEASGAMVGIVSLDDLLGAYASKFDDVAQVIGTERVSESAHHG